MRDPRDAIHGVGDPDAMPVNRGGLRQVVPKVHEDFLAQLDLQNRPRNGPIVSPDIEHLTIELLHTRRRGAQVELAGRCDLGSVAGIGSREFIGESRPR